MNVFIVFGKLPSRVLVLVAVLVMACFGFTSPSQAQHSALVTFLSALLQARDGIILMMLIRK